VCGRHHRRVADEDDTQLILQTLFDLKVKVDEIHTAVVEYEDEDEEGQEDG
jgi:hypothetical protein